MKLSLLERGGGRPTISTNPFTSSWSPSTVQTNLSDQSTIQTNLSDHSTTQTPSTTYTNSSQSSPPNRKQSIQSNHSIYNQTGSSSYNQLANQPSASAIYNQANHSVLHNQPVQSGAAIYNEPGQLNQISYDQLNQSNPSKNPILRQPSGHSPPYNQSNHSSISALPTIEIDVVDQDEVTIWLDPIFGKARIRIEKKNRIKKI